MAIKKEFLDRKLRFKTRMFIASGGQMYIPGSKADEHSPFSTQFLEALKDNGGKDQILTKTELKAYLEVLPQPTRFGDFGFYEPGSDFILSVGGYDQGKVYALLIGNSEYDQFDNLSNPHQDVSAIAEYLRAKYAVEAEVLSNATQAQFLEKLREYGKKQFSEKDQLLVYFAGHGRYLDDFGEGFLVMKDSKKDDQLGTTMVSQSLFKTIADQLPCEHVAIIMDGGSFMPGYSYGSR